MTSFLTWPELLTFQCTCSHRWIFTVDTNCTHVLVHTNRCKVNTVIWDLQHVWFEGKEKLYFIFFIVGKIKLSLISKSCIAAFQAWGHIRMNNYDVFKILEQVIMVIRGWTFSYKCYTKLNVIQTIWKRRTLQESFQQVLQNYIYLCSNTKGEGRVSMGQIHDFKNDLLY